MELESGDCIRYDKMGGEAVWNVSVEVVTLNSPGRHLKLLPGSFYLLNVASALFFFFCLPTTLLPSIILPLFFFLFSPLFGFLTRQEDVHLVKHWGEE